MMTARTHSLTLSACALAATLLLAACGGGASSDTVPPTVAITAAAGSGGAVTFSFAFSEDVGTSFTADDVAVTGGTKAASVTRVDATHYTLVVTPDSGATAVSAVLAASKYKDLANNDNVASASSSVDLVPTTAPTTPPARLAGDVVSIYSEAYTPVASVDMFPNWGQATTAAELTVAGNKIEKYGTLNYEGIAFTGSDVSAMTKLHLDVWTPNLSAIKVSIISPGPVEQAVTINPTQLGWNSIDIDMAQYTTPVKTNIIQIKLEALTPASGTLYVDNIYFYKPAATPVACGTTAPTCAPTTTIPSGAVTIYSEAATTPGFDAFPNWGQATQYSEQTLAGNKSLKYSALNYEGLAFTAVDVSTKGKVHLDIWSGDLSSVRFYVVSLNPTQDTSGVTVNLTPYIWNSVDIDLSSFPTPNMAAIAQLKFDTALPGAGTMYVDNIYFWGTASAGGGSGGSGGSGSSALPITFDETTAPSLIDFGGTTSTVVTDPAGGSNKVAMVTKGTTAEQWAGTTVAQLNVNPTAADNSGANAIVTIPFSASRKTMTLRVYSPAAGIRVHLKVENASNNGINTEQNAMTTVANAWETLSFNFADTSTMYIANGATTYDLTKPTSQLNLANTYNKASVFFDFGLGNGGYGAMPAQRVYYFENLNLAP